MKIILKDHLGLNKVKAQMVPKSLNFLDKQRRFDVCETMLSNYQDVMKHIISGNESWIYGYEPETDDQWVEYHGKGEPKNLRQSRLKLIFFDY